MYIAERAREQYPQIQNSPGPISVALGHQDWKFLLPFEIRDYTDLVPENATVGIRVMGDTMELRAIFGAVVDLRHAQNDKSGTMPLAYTYTFLQFR